MSTVLLTCDCNFNEPSIVDKDVQKVFKMFNDHLKKKTSPINNNSEIESVYEYNNLSQDNVRIFKKLADNNKSVIHLKKIEVDGDEKTIDSNNDDENEDENDNKRKKIPFIPKSELKSDSEPVKTDSEPESEPVKKLDSNSDSESDSDSDSEPEKPEPQKPESSQSESDSESEFESNFGSDSDSDSDSDSESKIIHELSTKLDNMQNKLESIERMLSEK